MATVRTLVLLQVNVSAMEAEDEVVDAVVTASRAVITRSGWLISARCSG